MAEEQATRTLNKEVVILAALAFATFWVFVLTKSMAAREQRMETRVASLWYERGKELVSSGDIEKATQSFRNASVRAADNRDYALALANTLATGHHNAEARQLLLRLRESDPENAEINTYLARLASQDQDISASVNYYQNALYGRWDGSHVDDRRRQLRIELIRLLLNQQKHDLVMSELLILEADSPDTAPSHLETAKLFLAAGDLQHALKNQTEALQLSSHDFDALSGAGETSFQLGDYVKARQYLRAALEKDPGSDNTRRRLALTAMVLDDDPLAPRLSAVERRDRLLLDVNRSLQRVDACLGQISSAEARAPLQLLKTQALAMEPALKRSHPPDFDAVKSAMGVILTIQKAASDRCGKPAPPDEALLLIGLEHNGAQP